MLTTRSRRCRLPFLLRRRSALLLVFAFVFIIFLWSEFREPTLNPFDLNTVSFRLKDSGDNVPRPWTRAKSVGRVFIAATHWHSEKILEQHWIPAVLSIILLLGRENVFVSIGASPGRDNTFEILRRFDKQLEEMGVGRKIVFGQKTHAQLVSQTPEEGDESGWIITPAGTKELRRIPYLAKQRNEVLEPLLDARVANSTSTFDRILWLNDVVFTSLDALELLTTRQGNYAAACALDFSVPGLLYDTFATRDSTGREIATLQYPFFGAGESRNGLLHSIRPAKADEDLSFPVKSCWNGMAAFDAQPFLPASSLSSPIGSPAPLKFRGIANSLALLHLEASECCLVHADNPLTEAKGVWVNPKVRVGYSEKAYLAARAWPSRQERLAGWFIRVGTRLAGLPWKKAKLERKVLEWEASNGGEKIDRIEPGKFCLVDEMQLMAANGWKHV
ncbi:cryptococcal mannosyltransferase 1-domain-containing protein [Coprinopsis sp. MPI-PUGE-AT-0042]|nr:cryptococcal mannosyltransferase 1-domain-containing protein [Coprinopsis sp. MPI-PUGE-AT-0042]